MRYTARLRQLTAMCVAGTEIGEDYLDLWFYRDGKNRLCIPGTTLAGIFIQRAKDLELFDDENYRSVTSKGFCRNEKAMTSDIRFKHLHLVSEISSGEVRQMVALDPKTHSAKPHALFSVEVTPPGTVWGMIIETENVKLMNMIDKVLYSWQQDGGFMGAMTTRGLGYFNIANIYKDDEEWETSKEMRNSYKSLYYRIPYTITVGEREDGYGLDMLHIGGSGYATTGFCKQDNFVGKHIPGFDKLLKDCDMNPVVTGPPGDLRPIIPGSTIKGALRDTARKQSLNQKDLKQFFGYVDEEKKDARKGEVYFPDLLAEDDYAFIYKEKHAEDEFTASTYASSKFNQIDVLSAVFKGEILSPIETTVQGIKNLIEKLPNNELMLGSKGSFLRISIQQEGADV